MAALPYPVNIPLDGAGWQYFNVRSIVTAGTNMRLQPVIAPNNLAKKNGQTVKLPFAPHGSWSATGQVRLEHEYFDGTYHWWPVQLDITDEPYVWIAMEFVAYEVGDYVNPQPEEQYFYDFRLNGMTFRATYREKNRFVELLRWIADAFNQTEGTL